MPKARANKTGFMIVHFYIRKKTEYNTMLGIIFQYGLEPVLIQRIIIGFQSHTGIYILQFQKITRLKDYSLSLTLVSLLLHE